MFKNKGGKLDPNTTDTLIGEGTIVEGHIRSECSIRVEGQVVGNIDCKGDITVGEKGSLQSNVTARNMILAGKVSGDVVTEGKLTITAQGKLYGNITTGTLFIEEGGIFQGQSQMTGDHAVQASQKEAAAASTSKS